MPGTAPGNHSSTSGFMQDTHANRPAAAASNNGLFYLETDTNGGTWFQSNGTIWVQLTPGVTAIVPTGLTGATAATRYVGGTTSGAPASGTFLTGDWITTQDGNIGVCTAGGTQGTWKLIPFNPMTTSGDIIYGGASGVPTRLAKGADGAVLTLAAGVPSWAAAGGGDCKLITASAPLGSPGASIDFTSIPGTYSSLRITFAIRLANAVTDNYLYLRLNNDSGSNYNFQRDTISGSGDTSNINTAQAQIIIGDVAGGSATAGYAAYGTIDIPFYALTTFQKGVISQIGSVWTSTTGQLTPTYGMWFSTAAITRVTLLAYSGNLDTGSTANLYGFN